MRTRREFLLASAAISALGACAGSPGPRREALPSMKRDPNRPVIDVHCHVFNGSDLAISGYVGALLTEKQGTAVLSSLVRPLTYVAQQAYAAASLGTPAEIELLSFTRPGEPLQDEFYRQKRHETDHEDFLTSVGYNLGRRIRAPEVNASTRPLPLDGRSETGELQSRRFLGYMLKPRATMALILDENSRRTCNGAVLLTPALVDMTRWVDGHDTWLGSARNVVNEQIFGRLNDIVRGLTGVDSRTSTIRDQMRLMRVLSERRPDGLLIHPFVPYDPWTGAVHLASGRSDEALRQVSEAVFSQGAAGVKLYPPMGFRADMNAALDASKFRYEFRYAIDRVQPTQSHPGYWLDQALDRLYGWCARNDVPLMAHTGPTHAGNGRKDYLERADPVYWEAVLKRHPLLRVNLGHFGGIWRWEEPDEELTSDSTKPSGRGWPEKIYELLRCFPGQAFADMADVPIRLTDDGQFTVKSTCLLKRMHHEFGDMGALRSGLMYGSDFPFTVMEGVSVDYRCNFETAVRRPYPGLGFDDDATDAVMWRNAACFLGLTCGSDGALGGTARRWKAFHVRATLEEGRYQWSEADASIEIDNLLAPFLVRPKGRAVAAESEAAPTRVDRPRAQTGLHRVAAGRSIPLRVGVGP